MAHPDATAGGEAGGATIQDAATRFSAYFDEKPDDTPPSSDDAELERGGPEGDDIQADEAHEAEAADETTIEQQDEQPPAAIDPPVSWSAEDKATFAKLPPEAQAIVAKRESEREKFVQSKATEAAEARKVVQAIEQQSAQAQQNYISTLQALLPEVPAHPDPNLLRQGEEGAALFYEQQAYREAVVAQHQQVQQLMSQAVQAQGEMDARARAAYDAEQHRILSDPDTGIPGWADPETREALSTDIAAAAQVLGYTPDRLNEVDATDVKALHTAAQWKAKADKYDALQKQKMEAVRAAKTLPAVTRPGTPSPKGSVQAERAGQHREQLKRTGNYRDAAKLFESII